MGKTFNFHDIAQYLSPVKVVVIYHRTNCVTSGALPQRGREEEEGSLDVSLDTIALESAAKRPRLGVPDM